MDYLSRLAAYSDTFRTHLHRLRADQPDAPAAENLMGVVREFLDLSIPAEQAAAWTAAGIEPGAARLLTEQQITPAEVAPYLEHFRGAAPHLTSSQLAVQWMLAAQPADIAAVWAACGFTPVEAAPLIAEGFTPPPAQITGDTHHHPGLFLHNEVARLTDQQPDLVIDPHRAGQPGQNHPHPDR